MNVKGKKQEKSSGVKRLAFLILLIFLLFGIVMCSRLTERRNKDKAGENPASSEKAGGVELVIDPDADNGLPSGTEQDLEQGVVIAGRDSMIFSANTKEQEVSFVNPEENAQMYYLTFELRLYDSKGQDYEVLYTSGLVEPGKSINRITLSRQLEKGEYDAVIHVQPYRMNEEKTFTNNADMRIRLLVD